MTKLAKDAGLSLSAMSKIEKGVRRLNQKQLLILCRLLYCKISDVFVKEGDDIALTWRTEMQKRLSTNEDSGLKVFGAGVRYLRRQVGITISDAAARAKMTLSVYHKLEVGQRDLFEPEVEPLAKVFGMTGDQMFDTIASLHRDGRLGKFISKTEEKVRGVLRPETSSSGVGMEGALYGAKIYDSVRSKLVPVFAEPAPGGALSFSKSDETMIAMPAGIEGRRGVYAVIPDAESMGPLFAKRATLFVDSDSRAKDGDMALYLSGDFAHMPAGETGRAKLVLVEANEHGRLIGRATDEEIAIKNPSGRLHKVIMITME
jgi:transcriptional regulator with XRE-family HTH domain